MNRSTTDYRRPPTRNRLLYRKALHWSAPTRPMNPAGQWPAALAPDCKPTRAISAGVRTGRTGWPGSVPAASPAADSRRARAAEASGGPGGGGRGGGGGFAVAAGVEDEADAAEVPRDRNGNPAFIGNRNPNNNRITGSIFYTVGNSVLNARPFSVNGLEEPKAAYAQNRYGISAGGPLGFPSCSISPKSSGSSTITATG